MSTTVATASTPHRTRCAGAQPLEVAANPDALLTPKTVRSLTGLSTSTLTRLQKRETAPFPKPVLIGTAPRWRAADVTSWLRQVATTRSRAPR